MLITLGASYKLQENHNSCTNLSVAIVSKSLSPKDFCAWDICATHWNESFHSVKFCLLSYHLILTILHKETMKQKLNVFTN